nr:hypothetical protein [Kutzneria sp. CA-103260]
MLKAGPSDSEVVDALDALSGALMVLSPAVLGVPAASVFGLFGAKNELVKAGKLLIRKMTGRVADDQLTRHDLLFSAYCLSCYTAFFEAVDRVLPEIRGALSPEDRVWLTNDALQAVTSGDIAGFAQYRIELPHPNEPIEKSAEQLLPLYNDMAGALLKLLRELSVWDDANEVTRDRIMAEIRELPEQALELYRGQYLALCVKFPEFSAWANLEEHRLTRRDIENIATDVRMAIEMLATQQSGIDVGLSSLGEILARTVPNSLNDVLSGLGLSYGATIDEPVIDDTYSSADGVDLQYPKKSEIFVPQAFRPLRYSRGKQLEDENMWEVQSLRDDIGAYILSYLASPYSLDTPLLILGQPGSGKSLLTEILTARLASGEYHPVRVKLRDVNPDSDIQDQIEEQIRVDTGHDVNWASLSASCSRPPLVVLDGYDELLQASGKVFGNYLKQVARFQHREQVQGRPVRVIVTSRVTLIDKVDVPIDTTIIRLEEFDVARQSSWIDIWNRVNSPYFQSRGVSPLVLPKSREVEHLARQPLLLLMLALYDSEGNRLSREQDIDQTALYNSLLLRFISRERFKDEQFRALPISDRNTLIADDLKRLGVAAIGMFNRRALHISKDDLQVDLEYFRVTRDVKLNSGVPLSQAELLLGSFFFVHESRSKLRGGTNKASATSAAYEFLHNTFGEFLAAEWMLATVSEQVDPVALMRAQPALGSTLQQLLDSRDGLPRTWFATLMVTPLFSRPMVLQMMRQWSGRRISDMPSFVAAFEVLLYAQLQRVLSDAELPTMLLGGDAPFPRAAALRNIATYTLNLVLLRCVIGGPFRVVLSRLSSDLSPNPWLSLVDLWRAGLGRENLMGLAAVLSAKVDEDGVLIHVKDPIGLGLARATLWGLFELGQAIGDDQLTALTGWALQDVEPYASPSLDYLASLHGVPGSDFRCEIEARSVLRRRAENGGIEHLSEELNNVRTASNLILRNAAPKPDRRTSRMMNRDEIALINAELVRKLLAFDGSFFRTPNDSGFVESLVSERPMVVADLISQCREQRTYFPLNVSSRKESTLGADLLDFLRDMSPEKRSQIVAELRYEMLACGIGVDEAAALLGPLADVWAIASRSRSAVLCLLDLSGQCGTFDWIRLLVETLAGRSGPGMVRLLGAPTTLTLLRQKAAWSLKPAKGQRSFEDLYGVVGFALNQSRGDERRTVVEEYIKLVASSPARWLASIEGPFEELAAAAEDMVLAQGGDLSDSVIKSLQVLRKKSRRRSADS